MRWLNQQTPYRFSAIFRFDGDMLRNVCLVDRLNPAVTKCPDQPVTDSYCIYIRRTAQLFDLPDSRADERVAGHPKQNSYHSYYGVPLFDRQHRMVGTVCHFDMAPVRVPESVVAALDELSGLIAEAAFPAS